jgi:hypothetical protein
MVLLGGLALESFKLQAPSSKLQSPKLLREPRSSTDVNEIVAGSTASHAALIYSVHGDGNEGKVFKNHTLFSPTFLVKHLVSLQSRHGKKETSHGTQGRWRRVGWRITQYG